MTEARSVDEVDAKVSMIAVVFVLAHPYLDAILLSGKAAFTSEPT